MNQTGIKTVRQYLTDQNLQAFLISDNADQFYLSGFLGDESYVVVDADNIFIVTDARFFEQIKQQAPDTTVVDIKETSLADFLAAHYQNIAIESDYLLTKDYQSIVEKGIKTTNADLVVKQLRMHKTDQEIDLISQAAEISDKVYDHIVQFMKVGMTELEVAHEIESTGFKLGAQKLSFDTIVASGARSAQPHGSATDKIIEDGDVVTLDFGFVYQNYYSDITRTVVMGKASDEVKKVYQAVKKAEEWGIKFAPLVETFGDLDRVIRDSIDDSGYGKYFNHGSGHGLGLVCHDYPIMRRSNNDQLEPKIVFTVEPGIYLPGRFGVRIEDDIYKNEQGESIRLTHSTNELIEI